jgi:hypothetical protein
MRRAGDGQGNEAFLVADPPRLRALHRAELLAISADQNLGPHLGVRAEAEDSAVR